MKTSKTFIYFLAFVIFVHLAYYLYAYFYADIYTQDSIGYLSQAENIIKHKSLYAAPWHQKLNPDWLTFRPPLYALFIIGCKFFYNSNYSILFFQTILSIITFVSVYRFLHKTSSISEYFIILFLAVVLLLYPSQLIHCNLIMSDILFQFIIFQAFIFSYRFFSEPSYKFALMASLLFIFGMMLKPVSFLLGFSVVLVFLFWSFKVKKIKFLLPFLLLPITYHAYCSYNKQVTGYYHYTTVTPYFVLKYMAKYTHAQLYGEHFADSAQAAIMKIADAQPDFGSRYEYMNNEGKKIIQQHWWAFTLFNIKGWLLIMIDPGRYDWYKFLNIEIDNFDGLYHLINTKGFGAGIKEFLKIASLKVLFILAICFVFNVVLLLLFVHYLLFSKDNNALKILVFIFVGYIVGATGVLGLARYRIAFAPILWLAATVSIHNLLSKKINVR